VTRSRSGPTSRAEFINLFGNETRVQILTFLWDCKHPTTADIARAVRADPSTVATHCKRLQDVSDTERNCVGQNAAVALLNVALPERRTAVGVRTVVDDADGIAL